MHETEDGFSFDPEMDYFRKEYYIEWYLFSGIAYVLVSSFLSPTDACKGTINNHEHKTKQPEGNTINEHIRQNPPIAKMIYIKEWIGIVEIGILERTFDHQSPNQHKGQISQRIADPEQSIAPA